MEAITIKQPWASLIVHGIKDIENRTWRTKFRGRVYIHSSGTRIKSQVFDDNITEQMFLDMHRKLRLLGVHGRTADFLFNEPIYAIIGEVDIIDCVINHDSIWAEKMTTHKCDETGINVLDKGQGYVWNWVLANPILYDKPILNVKGKLSFWEYTPPNN